MNNTSSQHIPLQSILHKYREQADSMRDIGTYFEHLMLKYFQNEPKFRQEYREVLTYAQWAEKHQHRYHLPNKKDTGIDLVATDYLDRHYAIQCKNYAPEHKMRKEDIDSFISASGKDYFAGRIVISTVHQWTENALDMLKDQTIPVLRIDLAELERSVIDWQALYQKNEIKLAKQYELRPHQQNALNYVVDGLNKADRGKLILACGTGKTFTSLRIAEKMAGKGKMVLFLVPSLALLSQTLNEWTQQATIPLKNYAVCSDRDVGKASESDLVINNRHDLDFPSTTEAKDLAWAVTAQHNSENMTVIYSTYHSIGVLEKAQKRYNLPEFDLIICDEAHRTTGATFEGEEESAFVRVHDNNKIKAKKRLYMTATPRVYSAKAKTDESVQLCSMDDPEIYGKSLFVLNFSQAVSLGLLVDYKVIVLAIEESHINRQLQKLLSDENNQLNVNDAAKIVGCWKALAKHGLFENDDYSPMQRAVAFCEVIDPNYKGKKHKVSSKLISEMFSEVVKNYQEMEITQLAEGEKVPPELRLACECEHVDGSMNASEKQAKISWLKENLDENTCHILSNVRCLSEGVDVPALDAVMFLTPRKSQIDVVQSVGRVMRKAPNKKQGYVILPVVIPAGVDPAAALDKNENYKVVWQVLNALRTHDDRFDAMINKIEFNGSDKTKMEVISVAEKANKKQPRKTTNKTLEKAQNSDNIGVAENPQEEIQFEPNAIERALYAKVVKKCGNRHHWEDWAMDVAKIAQTHIDRITALLENPEYPQEQAVFQEFATELRATLNGDLTDAEIIEMLAQHLITKPVFDALFEQYEFTKHNPVSKAMQKVLDVLEAHNLNKESRSLREFYDSVKMRASGIHSAEGKQRIILELYDTFFKKAFPRLAEKLGIVYTPVEAVDFIIASVENILQKEFNSSLGDEKVHILEPFTGTGTFITRLLQSGIIPQEKLAAKYENNIHANEIVLLAYYIACINIETTFHKLINAQTAENADETAETPYLPFQGMCLHDTFQLCDKFKLHNKPQFKEDSPLIGNTEDWVNSNILLQENNERINRQNQARIEVIITNPPYSSGQKSANDNNKNAVYPELDKRIRDTYAEHSTGTNKNSLYDSYIRAIRWASDRIENQGIIGMITNASFVDSNSMDGLRKCLAEEFSSLYIFHLRGNGRTSGERCRKEGHPFFGATGGKGGSLTPIAISILVKNPIAKERGKIYFHDIGDYLSRTEKLEKISLLKDINGITETNGWQEIIPNEFYDWLNPRDPNFGNYISLGDKKDKTALAIFENYSNGVKTNRDAWVYNYSKNKLAQTVEKMIDFYNSEVERYKNDNPENLSVEKFINFDPTKISWSRAFRNDLRKEKYFQFQINNITPALYRPFSKTNLYFSRQINNDLGQIPQIFPLPEAENEVFSVTGKGATTGFSAVMSNLIPDLNMLNAGAQCFPKYLYEETIVEEGEMESVVVATANSEQRTANSEQRTANSEQRTANSELYRQQPRKSSNLSNKFKHKTILCSDDEYHSRYSITDERAMFSDVPLRRSGDGGINMSEKQLSLFGNSNTSENPTPKRKKWVRRSAITDEGLAHFVNYYQPQIPAGEEISKEDLFYYIYGLLHSEEYREKYADNLSKQLPRIPRVKKYQDFVLFSRAGRELGWLHVNFEKVEMYSNVTFQTEGITLKLKSGQEWNETEIIADEKFWVEKMKHPKRKNPETGENETDLSRIIYNPFITIENIPEEAYEYIVNGKPAIEWIIDRQGITTDKKSGIENNANDWAIEMMNNPRYPLELLLRVITVSLKTQYIVNHLPKLEIE